MKVIREENPRSEDVLFLNEQINTETAEYGKAFPFAFFIRDDKENIIAGANGFVIYGAIYTDQLWVAPLHRTQGFARKLMSEVHKYGIQKGCKIATIQTMTFQNAVGFYERLGYKVDHERKGYVENSSCISMVKKL